MNKTWAKAGSIVSFVTSFFGFILALLVNSGFQNTEEKQAMFDRLIEAGFSSEEATENINFLADLLNRLQDYFLVFSLISVVLFVLIYLIKASNVRIIGTVYIVSAILHVITFRFLSFFLLLMAGLKMIKYSKQLKQQGDNESVL